MGSLCVSRFMFIRINMKCNYWIHTLTMLSSVLLHLFQVKVVFVGLCCSCVSHVLTQRMFNIGNLDRLHILQILNSPLEEQLRWSTTKNRLCKKVRQSSDRSCLELSAGISETLTTDVYSGRLTRPFRRSQSGKAKPVVGR